MRKSSGILLSSSNSSGFAHARQIVEFPFLLRFADAVFGNDLDGGKWRNHAFINSRLQGALFEGRPEFPGSNLD